MPSGRIHVYHSKHLYVCMYVCMYVFGFVNVIGGTINFFSEHPISLSLHYFT